MKTKECLKNSSYMYHPEMKRVQFDGHDMVGFADDIANQRVIEELEALKLCNGVGIDLETTIDEIIKQLKQEQI